MDIDTLDPWGARFGGTWGGFNNNVPGPPIIPRRERRKAKKKSPKCVKDCPCTCHEPLYGDREHPGRPCYGKPTKGEG